MPRTKEQFEAMRQATREKIFAAAGELFARKGLAGTNVQEIADLAGISIGLLYRHYKTKEELFDSLVGEASDGLVEIARIFSSNAPPADIIMELSNEVLTDIDKSNDFLNTIMFISQALGSGIESEALRKLYERDKKMLAAMERLIKRGQKEGSFRPGNPRDLALLFASAMQGICQFKLLLKNEYRSPAPETMASILIR